MRSTSTGPPRPAPEAAPSPAPTPAIGSGAARPETVMVCRLISGDLLVYGVPDGPLVLLIGDDAHPLRATLDTLLTVHPGRSR